MGKIVYGLMRDKEEWRMWEDVFNNKYCNEEEAITVQEVRKSGLTLQEFINIKEMENNVNEVINEDEFATAEDSDTAIYIDNSISPVMYWYKEKDAGLLKDLVVERAGEIPKQIIIFEDEMVFEDVAMEDILKDYSNYYTVVLLCHE